MELRSVFKLIKISMPDMNQHNKTIAKYLLENLDNTEKINLKEISEGTGQSKATIFRFCRNLGFQGFAEFRKVVNDLNNNYIYSNHEIVIRNLYRKDLDEFYDFYFLILKFQRQSIKSLIYENKIDASSILIKNAKKIIIAASNINYNQAIDFKNKLVALGLNCFLEQDYRTLISLGNISNEDDLFITISLSNLNKSVLSIGKLAKSNNAKWLHIGTKKNSLEDPNIDMMLTFESNESQLWNLYSLRGEGLFQILNLVFASLLNHLPEKHD